MSISLSKGGNVSLSREDPNLTRLLVGLGWDERGTDGAEFDLDASAFMLTASGRVRGDDDFVFYGVPKAADGTHWSPDQAVQHMGDNRTGSGDGDDEQIKIDLSRVHADIQKIAISVTIHDAEIRQQNFGMVGNAYIRVVNDETDREIARYDLSEDASSETAIIFGEIYRHAGDWKFRAVGQGFQGGLRPLCLHFGVDVA